MMTLKIDTRSYKIGINEIEGLKPAMRAVLQPIQDAIKERVYWSDCEIEETEYKSRDGFIPYSHNCGGLEISVILPKCEEYSFPFLEFGECDHADCGYDPEVGECAVECDGHLDAKLRVWLKFEGLEDGEMKFWLYLGGGNGDAPYFRAKHEATVFEADFTAHSLEEFRERAAAQVQRLLAAVQFR